MGVYGGSEGTLRTATALGVRLVPLPRAVRTRLADFTSLPQAGEAVSAIIAAGVYNSGILADPKPGATYNYAPAPGHLVERAQRILAVCARHIEHDVSSMAECHRVHSS